MLFPVQRVLFATDLNDHARPAQQFAQSLAARFGAELHVLHVVPENAVQRECLTVSPCGPDSSSPEFQQAREHLFEAASAQDELVVKSSSVVTMGNIIHELVDYVRTHDVDLVILGSHRFSGFARLPLTEMLVKLLTCPVVSFHPAGQSA